MKPSVRKLTETAVLLALLVTLQALTKPFSQLITGSCVNAILAIATLFTGLGGGIVIALISPVLAFLLGIAPNFITVAPIMLGNVCYVCLLHLLIKKARLPLWAHPLGVCAAAAVKFGVLYLLVVKVICGVASGVLLGQKIGQIVVLAPPMLNLLPTMFAWPQLFTALIGGGVALLITPILKKAIHR